MKKIKRKIKSLKREIRIFKECGMDSVRERKKNKEFHKTPSLDTLRSVHSVSEKELEEQRKYKFRSDTKISIITPLYNTPENFLIELLDSLREQTYENWELCLADGSDEQHSYIGEECRRRSLDDKRIRYMHLEENRGISENTNECVKMSSGDYLGLLDHDDILHPSALYEVVKAIENEHADFIYTDEVKFSGKIENIENPLDFNLKPGFGKYDLRSHNYICHFTVFNKKLLLGESCVYRKEFDGSQDHDMVLRLTEKAEHIVHVPKVLYYWRVHSNSVSMDLGSKPYAVDAAIHAVEAQLERLGEKGCVASNIPFQTIYRVKYDILVKPEVSIIIQDDESKTQIQKCVKQIVKVTEYSPLEIIYFSDSEIEWGEVEHVSFKFIQKNNMEKRAKMWNEATKNARGKHIILMSSKCIPMNPNWIDEMLMLSQKEDVGVVGPKIYYVDDRVAYGGVALWGKSPEKLKIIGEHDRKEDIGYEALLCHVRNTTAALSACMMFSKEIWENIGGFSEKIDAYEDIDFCLRAIDKHKNNVWTCFAEVRYTGKHILPIVTEQQSSNFARQYLHFFEDELYYHPLWEKLGLV